MTFRDIPNLGVWLLESDATPAAKLRMCVDILEAFDASLEQIGKAACHVAYRYLEGARIDKAEVEAALSRGLAKCDSSNEEPDWLTTRWRGSLLMAAIYIDIKHSAARQLIDLCDRMDATKAVAAHPPNVLNQMRAKILLSAWHHVNDDTRKGQQAAQEAQSVFQQAVAAAQWSELQSSFTLELAGAVRMIELAYELAGNQPDMAKVVLVEQSEPFRTALETVANTLPPPIEITRFDGTREHMARQFFTGIGVELGVAGGAFTHYIASLPSVMHVTGVDRWSDPHHSTKEYAAALVHVGIFARASLVRMTFQEAAELFQDESLDFVYVDGYAHTGQEDGQTLADWWPKIKPGGIMAGHDYHDRWPLTVEAVNRFARKRGLSLMLTNEQPTEQPNCFPSWMIRKCYPS
jgi:hypothetical protein